MITRVFKIKSIQARRQHENTEASKLNFTHPCSCETGQGTSGIHRKLYGLLKQDGVFRSRAI